MRRLHLEIHGSVQGVAFRAHTLRAARALGLDGWVRNRPDGAVEVLAEGDDAALGELLDFCRVGSPAAEVSDVREEWLDYVGELGPFAIRYG